MQKSECPDGPRRVGFLLMPKFSMMCLTSAIEPLRVANRFLERQAYSWHFFSVDGGPVAASNEMTILAEAGLDEISDFPVVGLVSSFEPFAAANARLYGWLRRMERRGCRLGAFDTGAFLLAEAGLLNGRRVTLHWESLAAFREGYPDIDVRDSLFEIDGPFFTCSGGTASLDLMLDLIAGHHSKELAVAVAEQFIHQEMRHQELRQRMPADRRVGTMSGTLVRIVETMEANIETPLCLDDLAAASGVTKRQLERLFTRHMGVPPQRYYLDMRLDRARQLLNQSDMPVFEVGLACGFTSAPYFTRAYRRRFGYPPSRENRP
jgi:AraC family carnitine catabolism transcriptional activator